MCAHSVFLLVGHFKNSKQTPFKKTDHTNKVANPEKLAKTEVGEAAKQGEDLAAPITFTPYKARIYV